jgi:hypothetical protein
MIHLFGIITSRLKRETHDSFGYDADVWHPDRMLYHFCFVY